MTGEHWRRWRWWYILKHRILCFAGSHDLRPAVGRVSGAYHYMHAKSACVWCEKVWWR